jgi:hypothetical protein
MNGSDWQTDDKQPVKSVVVNDNQDALPFMHVALACEEIPVVVGGVTNMVFALSKVDGVAGSMAARTWVDALGEAYRVRHEASKRAGGDDDQAKEKLEALAQGIVKGVGQFADVTMLTREFGPRVQIMSLIKSGECIDDLLKNMTEVGPSKHDGVWSWKRESSEC